MCPMYHLPPSTSAGLPTLFACVRNAHHCVSPDRKSLVVLVQTVLMSLITEARRTSTCIRILLRFVQSLDIQQYPSRHVTCWKLFVFLRHVIASISARSKSPTRWTRATSTSASPSPPPSSARWPSSTLSSERQRGASEPERYACT